MKAKCFVSKKKKGKGKYSWRSLEENVNRDFKNLERQIPPHVCVIHGFMNGYVRDVFIITAIVFLGTGSF